MANRYWVGGTGTWDASDTTHWSASSGGAGGSSVPGASDDVIFNGSSGGGTVTVNTNFSVLSVTMGAFTGTLTFATNNNSPTMQTFSGTGTGTRTLSLGSGTFFLTGSNTTIWDFANGTNLTFNAGTAVVKCTYSGGTGSRTLRNQGTSATNLWISAGTDSIILTSTYTAVNLDFTGFAGTLTNTSIRVGGNLTMGSSMTVTSGSSDITFINAGASNTITSNGVAMNIPLVFNSTGSTWTLQDDLSLSGASARSVTLTAGTLAISSKTLTCDSFLGSGTGVRSLSTGTGTIVLTGSAETVWTTSTSTNMTITGTGTVKCTYSGSTGSRFVITGNNTDVRIPNLWISAGTDTFTTNNVFVVGNLDFTGFTGTWTSNTTGVFNVAGNLTLQSSMTVTISSSSILILATDTSQTITSNGVSIGRIVRVGGGGTVNLADAFTIGAGFSLQITNGILTTNGYSVTAPSITSTSGANTKMVNLGASTVTLTDTGTVWNMTTGTNVTVNAGTSTIVMNNATASSKTFAGGNFTYYNLQLSGAGTGTFIIGTSTGTTTFNAISVLNPPHTVQVFAGKTLAMTGTTPLVWSGTAGNLNTFQSTSNGTAWNVTAASSSTVEEDYISLQDSHASGGAVFYAGSNSTDVSGNTGWFFYDPGTEAQDAAEDENHVFTVLAALADDPTKTIRVQVDPSTHALKVDDGTDGQDYGPDDAPRDSNHRPAIMGVSSADGVTPVVIYTTPDGKLLIDSN